MRQLLGIVLSTVILGFILFAGYNVLESAFEDSGTLTIDYLVITATEVETGSIDVRVKDDGIELKAKELIKTLHEQDTSIKVINVTYSPDWGIPRKVE